VEPPSQQRLRIAYLFQQFPIPTETFAVSDIGALIARGHEVTAYTMKFAPPNEEALLQNSAVPGELQVFRPKIAGAMKWPSVMWRWRKEIAWLARRIVVNGRTSPVTCLQALFCIPRLAEIAESICDQKFDVVHAFWSRHVGLTLPLLNRRGAQMLRTTFVGAYDLVADDFITDLVAESADALFSHAEVNRPYLERKARRGASIEIIHRGIPLARNVSSGPRTRFRLVTASALVPCKNVEAVIKCFADARGRFGQLTLDIFGDGPDRPRLVQLAQQLGCSTAVHFNGHIPREALFAQLEKASIFILLSKKPSERLPNVIKEALLAGCAVISSNSEGIEELIPDEGLGLVVNPDDQPAIDTALTRLLGETDAEAEARRKRARSFIASNFSSDASMRRYVEAWLNDIAKRGAANALNSTRSHASSRR
jgi:glycosyltransferase involved in cell wall biosynthesis